METSILTSTKKILGLAEDYTAFDLDVVTHINSVFSTLNQMGIGPDEGFSIQDDSTGWDDYVVPSNQLHMIKTYMYLKVRMLFDPPTTSYLIDAMNAQIKEQEFRLSEFREGLIQIPAQEEAEV